MKKRPLLLLAACALTAALPALAQEKPSPSPAAKTPATIAAVPPSPAPSPKMTAEKVADSPTNSNANAPSPVSATTSESEAAATVALPSPTPDVDVELTPPPAEEPEPTPPPRNDADYLPEPTDSSLGAATEPLPTDRVAPGDLPNPDTLIPPGSTPATTESSDEPPAAPKIQENKYDQDRKLAIRYQEVKLIALKDEVIRGLQDQADVAKTDEGKRQALRAYYRSLFAKMTAIDPTLQVRCDQMQLAYLRRVGQYRVAPTIPLNPPPTPEPLPPAPKSAASPTPKPKTQASLAQPPSPCCIAKGRLALMKAYQADPSKPSKGSL